MNQKFNAEEPISLVSGLGAKLDLSSFLKRENWTRTWQLGLLVAFVGTAAYYLPLLGGLLPGHAHWPGFMLTGDQRMGYFPSFVEGYRRFWHGGLLGIDFLINDGASVFAYRPNLMPFYPPFIGAYLLADCSNLRTAMLAYTAINVLHQFFGLFFSFVFVRRYLGFPSASAALAATIYGLTWYSSAYSGEATFYFQMMLLPVAACAFCWLMHTRSRLAPIWASPVFITVMLSNYGPTMLASLGLAVVAALIAYWMWIDAPEPRRLSALTRPLASLFLAGLVCLPYFYGQVRFKAIMAPTADDIDPVTHDLAFSGYDLLNALSPYMEFRRTHFEAILVWGSLPIFLCIFGLDVLIKRKSAIRARYLRACGAAALVYLLVLLPTFGRALLPAADAFYYAVPFMGRMHIFQRYLAFAQFFFAIAVSGLATIAVAYASTNAKRVAAYAGIAIWLGVSVALQIWTPPAPTDVNALLVEVFLLAMGAVALAATTPTTALLIVSVLIAVVGLNVAYVIPLATNRLVQWTAEPDPLGAETRSMVDFFKANDGGKALTKIAVVSTDIMPYFNRNLPWLLGKEVKVMSYQGYPPHLSNLADYQATQFGPYGVFDQSWLKETSLDFVFWNDAMAAQLQPFTAAGYQMGPILTLPGGNHLAKVSLGADAVQRSVLLDLSPATASQWPKPMELQGWTVQDGRLVKAGHDQARFGFIAGATPGVSYQVDMDVNAATAGQLVIAHASQVIGIITTAGPMHFSKRVDAKEIGDLWITASPTFTGSLSNVTVKLAPTGRPAVTFDNGILRYAGPPGAVKGFKTNYTTRIKLNIDAPVGGTVTYLLWPNPHMAPYVDGARAAWVDPAARPLKINIGPGRHRFEMRFVSRAGTLFIWSSILYLIGLAASIVGPFALPHIEHYRRRLRSA